MKIKIDVDIPPAPDGGKLVVVRAKDVPVGTWYFSATLNEWRFRDDNRPFAYSEYGTSLGAVLVVRSVPPKPEPVQYVTLDGDDVLRGFGYKNQPDGVLSVDASSARLRVADEIANQTDLWPEK